MRFCSTIVALIFTAGALLTGCARQNTRTAPSGNQLTVALAQEPVSLDPLLLEGPTAYAVGDLFYSYLTNYDSDGNQIPDLALQVPTLANGGVSSDGMHIVFHLRRGIRWQDGAPLTAADVVFTYRAIMNPDNAIPSRFGYDAVASVGAPDAYTVRLVLKRPLSPIVPFFFGGDSNYPIMPEHVLGRYASVNKAPFNTNPIGSGPYKLVRWDHGDRLVLAPNPLYYRGKAAIGRLVLPFIHDQSTIENELVTNEVQAAFELDASRISQLRAIPGHRIVVTPVPYFYAMGFNTTDPVLRDPNVRRALAMAIDRATIVRKVSHGLYDAGTGMRGLFTWAFDPHADTLQYNQTQAAALLTRATGGKRLHLQLAFPAGSDIAAAFATEIAAAESAVGVDVSLKRYTREVYLANDGPLLQGRFQLQIYGYSSNYDPDASWLLACDQRSPNGFNLARYCNAAVDAALQRARESFDRSVRVKSYAQVQRQIAQDLPYYFICQGSEIDAVPDYLNHYAQPLLSPFNSAGAWTLAGGRVGNSDR